MANDPTVKAGSWGARTVEKIVRLTEYALEHELPVFYLVDSAGARITDQVELFPGRRGAGRIFYNEVRLSGRVPQICCLFGPSAAGGAYIPAFCDVVFMVEGNASMYLGSPRMAEMVVGEITDLEEMGGARMHATVSGCGDNLVPDDDAAPSRPPGPTSPTSRAPGGRPRPARSPALRRGRSTATTIPESARVGYDVHAVIDGTRRRRLVLRAQAAVRPGARHRLGTPRGALDRRRGEQPASSRAACCSPILPTRRPASSGARTRSTCRCCFLPTCPGS